jgi:hypothetical protein
MKKAKLMLAGVAVLAVVGGALAFKAKTNFIGGSYCITNTFNGRTSLISTELYETTIVGGTQQFCNPTTYFNLATTQVVKENVVVE